MVKAKPVNIRVISQGGKATRSVGPKKKAVVKKTVVKKAALIEPEVQPERLEVEKEIESQIQEPVDIFDTEAETIASEPEPESEPETENDSVIESQPQIEGENSLKAKRSVKLYRRIAYFFICLVLVLVAAVAYFNFVRVTIVLVPNQEKEPNNLIFDVGSATTSGTIPGVVKEMAVEYTGTYQATGEKVTGEEVVGKAVIYNNYSKAQPLVATTRLLAADGTLYRLKNTVSVPVGGKVEIEIYADEPSEDAVISPSKFTIPGLWAGIQDKIYAESKDSTVYQKKIEYNVSSEDISNSVRDMKAKLMAKAKDAVNEAYSEYSQIIFNIDENSVESKVKAESGDKIESFEASMNADVVIIAFNGEAAAKLAESKFAAGLDSNKEMIGFDPSTIVYNLNNYDLEGGKASLNASFEGVATIKDNVDLIDRSKIVGLNNEQLEAYLNSLSDVAGFEIKYQPFFLKSIPKYIEPSKIEIIIKK